MGADYTKVHATQLADAINAAFDETHGLKGGKKKRRPHKRQEEKDQTAYVQYLEAVLPKGWIVHHSRNGGRSKGENGRAKAMGAKAGFPDLMILGQRIIVPPRGLLADMLVPAVYLIEVKTQAKGSALSSDQRKLHNALQALGFPVGVIRSLDELRALLNEWNIPTREVR